MFIELASIYERLRINRMQAFVCFARVAPDGKIIAAALWAKKPEGCRRLVVMSENPSQKPKTVINKRTLRTQFQAILNEFKAFEIETHVLPYTGTGSNEYSDFYGIKERSRADDQWVIIAGGVYSNSRLRRCRDWVYRQFPILNGDAE